MRLQVGCGCLARSIYGTHSGRPVESPSYLNRQRLAVTVGLTGFEVITPSPGAVIGMEVFTAPRLAAELGLMRFRGLIQAPGQKANSCSDANCGDQRCDEPRRIVEENWRNHYGSRSWSNSASFQMLVVCRRLDSPF